MHEFFPVVRRSPLGRTGHSEEGRRRTRKFLSCSHGVSRWYKDCGCTTGSEENWNQSWRTALREALDKLNDRTEKVFQRRDSKAFAGKDPDELRNAYISVLNGNKDAADFLSSQGVRDKTEHSETLQLLEGQKYAMYMFTSCGWFFADISGVEPGQNLLYAARLFELYADLLSPEAGEEFQKTLRNALSNIPGKGDGAELYRKGLGRMHNGLLSNAASLILADIYNFSDQARGRLFITKHIPGKKSDGNGITCIPGIVTLEDRGTGSQTAVSYLVREDSLSFIDICVEIGEQSLTCSLRELSHREQSYAFR